MRLDRLQEYPSTTLGAVCRSLGIEPVTAADLAAATPSDPSGGHDDKHRNPMGRIRFLFDNPVVDEVDAIMLANGSIDDRPELDEPHIFDGRHRFVAAVLRGASTILAHFRWDINDVKLFLSRPAMAYLVGDTDVKPRGTKQEWEQCDQYEEWY